MDATLGLTEVTLDGDASPAERARSERAGFEAIYLAHRDRVLRYLVARVGDADLALDLTATTFERALLAIDRYRPRNGGMAAWLLRIARNAAIDQARRPRAVPLDGTPAADIPDDVTSLESAVIAADDGRRIRQAVAALGWPERDAIGLRFGAGMTAAEIGHVIGKSEAATQKLISRALGRLREVLDDHD